MSAPSASPGQSDPLLLDLTCAPRKPLLAVLRRMVVCVAEEIGFADDDLLKIEMAVDEACTNAFIHGYPEGEPKGSPGIELRLLIEPEAFTIQIRDHGRERPTEPHVGVDSLSAYADPDRDRYHGLGILIMKQCMDEVEFSAAEASGTLVVLRKSLKPGLAGAA